MHRKLGIVLVTVLGVSRTASAQPAERKQSLAVMAVEANGISASDVATLSEVLTTELSASGRYEVISARDIQAMLQQEASRQEMGCDDASCFAEIGGALGAELLLIPQFNLLGETYVVNIKLVSVKEGRILRRVYERVDGDLDDLLDAIRYSVAALLDPNAGEGVVRGRPLISPLPLIIGGVGLAALGSGIGFGLAARNRWSHSTDSSYAGGQLEVAGGETAQLIANISFAAAGVCAISGTLLYLLFDTDLFSGTVAVSPAVDGPGVSFFLRF